MDKRQISDSNECSRLDGNKNCFTCSCMVCIAQLPKTLSGNDYQKAALRTANSDKPEDLILNGILGLCGETGEVSDLIKKWKFQGHELNRDKLINELGDVCWYIAILSKGLNVDLETVMQGNIDKLMKRYPEGFSVENSLCRDAEDA